MISCCCINASTTLSDRASTGSTQRLSDRASTVASTGSAQRLSDHASTTYSLAERERLLREFVRPDEPHVLLVTCNRVELYTGEGAVPDDLVRHIYRVVSGLESSLVGERAVQGQVKEAYRQACERYSLSSTMHKLFQSAFHAGKRVRTETRLSQGAVSHSQVTVEMIKRSGIDLCNKIVGLIGINRLTEDILKFLTDRQAVNVLLSNRNFGKADHLAARYGGTAFPLSDKPRLLAQADVLICATSAPHYMVQATDIPPEKPMLIFDLAFPRDVEPSLAERQNITLYNLEDIERFAQQNRTLRREEISRAEAIIEEEIIRFRKR